MGPYRFESERTRIAPIPEPIESTRLNSAAGFVFEKTAPIVMKTIGACLTFLAEHTPLQAQEIPVDQTQPNNYEFLS